jgi:hypothetical protein
MPLLAAPPVVMVAAVKREEPATVMAPPFVAVVQKVESPKIIKTPYEEYHRHCLYVRDLVLCRTNGEGSYLVDSALTVNTTLADTGAGPSVVTTSLLDTLPDDVCITRALDERPTGSILRPDGSPLISRGYAHLTFSLSGTLFRHKFLVIEGNPMLLFGNDFLAAHAANIKLNCNGDEGTISLSSATCKGKELQFNVSTGPRPESSATVATAVTSSSAPDPVGLVPLPRAKPLTIDFSRDPREPFSSPLFGQEAEIEPLFGSADELAARAPVSSSSEYLLYADHPLRIPGLSRATFLVPAPHALRDHSKCSFFVDRLPTRDGLVDTP